MIPIEEEIGTEAETVTGIVTEDVIVTGIMKNMKKRNRKK